MGRAVAAGHIVDRRAEADRLAAEHRFERISAGLRKQHLGLEAIRHRHPIGKQILRRVVQTGFDQKPRKASQRCLISLGESSFSLNRAVMASVTTNSDRS